MLSNENLYNACSLAREQTTTTTTLCIRICILIMNINGSLLIIHMQQLNNYYNYDFLRVIRARHSISVLTNLFAAAVCNLCECHSRIAIDRFDGVFTRFHRHFNISTPSHVSYAHTKNPNENARAREQKRIARQRVRLAVTFEWIFKQSK